MKLLATERFVTEYGGLPRAVQKQADRRLRYLARDLSHPSLRVKRVRSREGVYEGSINMDYRFLFRIHGDQCILLRVGRHDIIDAP